MKVTTIIPEALIPAVNRTYFLLGMARDVSSHTRAAWQDAKGNAYAVSSGEWSQTQLGGVQQVAAAVQGGAPVAKVIAGFDLYPAFYAAYGDAGVALVGDAAAVFDTWQAGSFAHNAARIVAMVHDDPHAALAMAGITQIPSDDE